MPTYTRNTIVLKGDLGSRYDEKRAGGTIKPGHLLRQDGNAMVQVHNTAGVALVPVIGVAIEDALQGKNIDDNYVPYSLGPPEIQADVVRYFIPQPGDEVQLILKTGQNADEGNPLTSNGDGTVKVATATDKPIFEAMEAVNAAAADTRIVARRIPSG